jgi:Fe-S-cluster-containing dehydrogenase component
MSSIVTFGPTACTSWTTEKRESRGVIFIRYEEDAKPVVTSENGVGSADLVKQVERGKFPNTQRHFLPRLCNHCEEPACVAACPTKASYRREDGIILIREERCIGCKLCMAACPFDARFLQPDKGIVNKCTFCEHRVDQGVVPACVNTCQGKARAAVEELLRERDLQKAHELFQVQSVRLTELLHLDNPICNLRPYLVQCSGSPDTKKSIFSLYRNRPFC